MTLTDSIAEMITIIRNGLASRKKEVKVCDSRLKEEILKILKKENFIEDFKKEKEEKRNYLLIILKYNKDLPAITQIRRISKPGRRIYVDKTHIPNIQNGRGKAIISTSKGLLTESEARKYGIGGEVILEVW